MCIKQLTRYNQESFSKKVLALLFPSGCFQYVTLTTLRQKSCLVNGRSRVADACMWIRLTTLTIGLYLDRNCFTLLYIF